MVILVQLMVSEVQLLVISVVILVSNNDSGTINILPNNSDISNIDS